MSFDPRNPKYKCVQDLPAKERENFTNLPDGGFVRKNAVIEFEWAQVIAEIIERAKLRKTASAVTVLKAMAHKMQKNYKHIIVKERYIKKYSKGEVSIEDIPKILWMDREFVNGMAAIENDAINFAACWYKSDKDLVMAAVSNFPESLQYVSFALRDDKEVVRAAIKKGAHSFYYASKSLRSDYEFVLEEVKKNGRVLFYASDELKDNINVVIAAVENNGMALEGASEDLRKNWKVVFAAVRQNGLALQFAHYILREDPIIVREAVRNNPEAFKEAYGRLSDQVKGLV